MRSERLKWPRKSISLAVLKALQFRGRSTCTSSKPFRKKPGPRCSMRWIAPISRWRWACAAGIHSLLNVSVRESTATLPTTPRAITGSPPPTARSPKMRSRCMESNIVALKGLSQYPLYTDDPRQRPQYDIDIYISGEAMPTAAKALRALGYGFVSDTLDPGADHLARHDPPNRLDLARQLLRS